MTRKEMAYVWLFALYIILVVPLLDPRLESVGHLVTNIFLVAALTTMEYLTEGEREALPDDIECKIERKYEEAKEKIKCAIIKRNVRRKCGIILTEKPICAYVHDDGKRCEQLADVACKSGPCAPLTLYCSPHYDLAHEPVESEEHPS